MNICSLNRGRRRDLYVLLLIYLCYYYSGNVCYEVFIVRLKLFFQIHNQHQMQFSQSLGPQQFQSRQLTSGSIQHGIGQSQLNQGNQLNRHLNQFSSPANSALFNAAQTTPNTQMVRYSIYIYIYIFHSFSIPS